MNHPETNLQKAIVQFFRASYPKVKLSASMNGARRSLFEQGQAKALGIEPGHPDVTIYAMRHGYGALFLEVKAGKSGVVSDAQRDYMNQLMIDGYKVEVVRDLDTAMEIIKNYMR